ncbi:ASTRA complex subunit [Podila clonocystis]|nr:ASTRA complex subunit [Podila clonocystis]
MTLTPSLKTKFRSKPHIPLPPPTPSFIFRGHDAPIHSLEFFASNAFLMTGDELGWICVWDVWKRRQVYKWHAHPSGSVLELLAIPYRSKPEASRSHTPNDTAIPITATQLKPLKQNLGLSDHYIVSHGRDYEIHVWDINTILNQSIRSGSSLSPASSLPTQTPTPVFSLPVNALNFCKMSIIAIENPAGTQKWSNDTPLGRTHQHIYIAVPSPTSTAMIDVYDIVTPERTFASVGSEDKVTPINVQDKKWGAAMGIRLFQKKDTSDLTESEGTLHMLVGYEDGSMTLFREQTHAKSKRLMEVVWTIKCHLMAMDISSDHEYAVSCSSDSLMVKYRLFGQLQGVPEIIQVPLRTTGVADAKFRNDNRILALAGWDGKIRVFSAKTLKPLAVLQYHREGLYCLDFANVELKLKDIIENDAVASVFQDDQNDQNEDVSVQAIQDDTQNPLPPVAIDDDSDSQDSEDREASEESDDDSDLEDSIKSRAEWSKRHWLAAGGKENRISLWEIY